ncbi:MAG TPA: hypothetical protein VNH64_09240 [Parvularculaceae bacterium]|nr:hypothetical protein [Parvularculaceae bacterium]
MSARAAPSPKDQPDLFGAEATPRYTPDPDKVRARIESILSEARAATTMPWERAQLSLYRAAFPSLICYLPDGEAARYAAEFEAELTRLDAAA